VRHQDGTALQLRHRVGLNDLGFGEVIKVLQALARTILVQGDAYPAPELNMASDGDVTAAGVLESGRLGGAELVDLGADLVDVECVEVATKGSDVGEPLGGRKSLALDGHLGVGRDG
jgi:hypothetical protein